ncbi:MAG TPA: porin, partial [Caulobacteraceae bacterium]|nr:porin [Caulobacteraceae bacterium]
MKKTAKLTARLLGSAAVLWSAGAGGALAADEATLARIQALEAQLATLQQQLTELKAEAAKPAGKEKAARVSIDGGKPTIASADGAFTMKVKAVMQLDAAHYFQDEPLPASVTVGRDLNSGTHFRRGRLGVEGKMFGDFDYGLLLDFGGSGTDGEATLHELWLQYSAIEPLAIRVGAFAPNVGLSDAASTNGSLFPERPSA